MCGRGCSRSAAPSFLANTERVSVTWRSLSAQPKRSVRIGAATETRRQRHLDGRRCLYQDLGRRHGDACSLVHLGHRHPGVLLQSAEPMRLDVYVVRPDDFSSPEESAMIPFPERAPGRSSNQELWNVALNSVYANRCD